MTLAFDLEIVEVLMVVNNSEKFGAFGEFSFTSMPKNIALYSNSLVIVKVTVTLTFDLVTWKFLGIKYS